MELRRHTTKVAFTIFSLLLSALPSAACVVPVRQVLSDIDFADVVVVGRIQNYEIVRDQVALKRRQELLQRIEKDPKSFEIFKTLKSASGSIWDYARFDVRVERFLKGDGPETIKATWNNSTFGEPEAMPSGAYLIAFRSPKNPTPPLRGPSATILPNPEPDLMTVLQAPCTAPFIFEIGGDKATAIVEAFRSGDFEALRPDDRDHEQ